MIDLTPLEVRKKKGDFRRTMRGYEPQAVDEFLDLVADRLEQIVREHMALNERVSAIDAQIADYRERERALTEALVSAQEMREDMRRQMEREADLKRREAEQEADTIRANAEQSMQREEENIRRLRARQSGFVQSYRNFLERELAELAVIAEGLDGSRMMGEETPAPKRKAKRGEDADAAGILATTTVPPKPLAPEPPAEPSMAAASAATIAAVAATLAPEAVRAAPEEKAAARPEAKPEPAPIIPEPERVAVIPEPEPVAVIPEPEPAAISAEPEPEARFPESFETDFDALLDEVPFAPVEEQRPLPLPHTDQLNLNPEPAPPPPPPAAAAPEPEAEPEPDLVEIDLVDEVAEDDNNDNDGWISTLLEGKGD